MEFDGCTANRGVTKINSHGVHRDKKENTNIARNATNEESKTTPNHQHDKDIEKPGHLVLRPPPNPLVNIHMRHRNPKRILKFVPKRISVKINNNNNDWILSPSPETTNEKTKNHKIEQEKQLESEPQQQQELQKSLPPMRETEENKNSQTKDPSPPEHETKTHKKPNPRLKRMLASLAPFNNEPQKSLPPMRETEENKNSQTKDPLPPEYETATHKKSNRRLKRMLTSLAPFNNYGAKELNTGGRRRRTQGRATQKHSRV